MSSSRDDATSAYLQLEKISNRVVEYDVDDTQQMLFRELQRIGEEVKQVMYNLNIDFKLKMEEK